MEVLRKYRAIAQEECDRVRFLARYATPTDEELAAFEMRAKVAQLQKDISKMKLAFSKLLKSQMKTAGINLVIDNLPDDAIRQCDDKPERITGKSIHETMNQFGSVHNAVVYKNHAYVWFDNASDSKYTHDMVNNMMIGNNIVSTAVVV